MCASNRRVRHGMHPTPRCLRMNRVGRHARVAALAVALLVMHAVCRAADPPAAEPIPFPSAVELALQHSGVMGIATINQWRAQKSYQEASRQLYSPNHHRLRSGLLVRISTDAGRLSAVGSELYFGAVAVQSFPAAIYQGRQDRLERYLPGCAGQAQCRHSGHRAQLRATGSAHQQDRGFERGTSCGR